ncbi:chorismate mutase [Rufibacter roseus]|uniref:chorismate mutase n=1 Tax=Rufibacter roseus TaxID=1567108 RepID=A0ABW2DU64_9BACT|nr:chorismate mutase [Rufibacter roseus]
MTKTLNLSAQSVFRTTNGQPLIIAGPCSAESEEQMLETARGLAAVPEVTIFRAGIWKPRTRPGAFEGIGKVGLKWLKTVKEETGLKTACEVATAEHVNDALKQGVDILWVGARTTVNPFSVQEIADALEGVDVPVLVKNPVNPDLQLWLGALERLNRAGITDLGAIHRGFSSFDSKPYRNHPKWNMAYEFKKLLPEIPLICDPSHIAGKRSLLQQISQEALNLQVDGLMIETHCNPDVALSDAAQQVTPEGLRQLLDSLVVTVANATATANEEELAELRNLIDYLDNELINVLARRSSVSKQIGIIKKENKMNLLQTGRWEQVMEQRLSKAQREGLEENFVKAIFQEIHQYSLHTQAATVVPEIAPQV